MERNSLFGGVLCTLAFAFLSGPVALAPMPAQAAAAPTCSETARAYADGEISNITGVEFLKTCVADRIAAFGAADEARASKPKGATVPLTCHEYAGKLAVEPRALSVADLAYLDACLDADIRYRREGK